jgi:hypothetical protein
MPSIDLTEAELAPITAAIRRAVEEDRFARAPRLNILRSALAKLEVAAPQPAPPKAPQAGKRDRR